MLYLFSSSFFQKCLSEGRFSVILVFFLVFFSCTGRTSESIPPDTLPVIPVPEEAADAQNRVGIPVAILKSGDNPLWFELGSDGPALISSPDHASLKPYTPWALSLFITGIAMPEDRLVMAVNRDGFLLFEPWRDTQAVQDKANVILGIGLFRIANADFWGRYTASPLFLINRTPAVLLYRDDFFDDVSESPPSPQIWSLAGGLLGMELGTFAPFALEEGWEIDVLRMGSDDYWYYRCVRHKTSPPELTYRRTPDLSQSGEPVSLETFRNSAMPEPVSVAPALLRQALNGAFLLSAGQKTDKAVSIVSPEFPCTKQFAPGPFFSGEDMLELAGYYSGKPEFALVIERDGRGVYVAAPSSGTDAADEINIGLFALPALPQGFVYTHIGCLGKVIIAAWEEQETLSIGAAGFVVMDLPEEIRNVLMY
jgi:hypothetical protein